VVADRSYGVHQHITDLAGRYDEALLRSGKGSPVGSSAKLASMSQPALSLLFRLRAAARLSTPDLLLSARSPFSRSQKKPWPTTCFVGPPRFLRCAASFICLRKASNVASFIACGGLTETTF